MARYIFDWAAFRTGMKQVASIEFLVLCVSFIGFGALIHDSQLELAHGIFMSVFIWAMPGQVVLLNMLQEGAAPLAIALAVTLTAVRLMPMVMAVMPLLRTENSPRWLNYCVAYFIAITMWILSNRCMGDIERPKRLPWLLGVGVAFLSSVIVVTTIGYHLAGVLPPVLAMCVVFITPLFFFTSLLAAAKIRMDYMALVFGCALGPIFYVLIPEFDLLIAGVSGGTIAYFLGRHARENGQGE